MRIQIWCETLCIKETCIRRLPSMPTCYPCCGEGNDIPSFIYFYILCLKNLGKSSLNMLMKFLLIFFWLFMRNYWTFLMTKRKILMIILFLGTMSLSWQKFSTWNLKYRFGERNRFINNIFQLRSGKEKILIQIWMMIFIHMELSSFIGKSLSPFRPWNT